MILEKQYTIQASTEKEAQEIIDEYAAKQKTEGYYLKKRSIAKFDKKSKGEIIASTYIATVVLVYADKWDFIAEVAQ